MSLTPTLSILAMLVVGVVSGSLALVIRRRASRLADVQTGPWSSTLSYVATAYGVVVGFSILFLFGTFADARQAVGEEATSVGTAFTEMQVFGEEAVPVQQALICYAQAVVDYDWPAMREGTSAPEVDRAYTDIVVALGAVDEPLSGTLQPAIATNVVLQVGNVSTARESRLVTAATQLPVVLWILLLGGGVLVSVMIFVVTLPASPPAQAVLVGLATTFTTVLVLLVLALNNPFAPGPGRVSPALIAQTADSMTAALPQVAAEPCDLG
ncbi:MAG: hypothetical protein WCA82_01190 [Jiangellales bacterium]